MYIYDSQEEQITHALEFLKGGLKNNESCLLVADYSLRKKQKRTRNNHWESSTDIRDIKESDIRVVSSSDWFLARTAAGLKVNNKREMWINLSSKRQLRGKSKVRAFVDMSILYRCQLVDDLVECEYRVANMRNLPIKLICAYIESDISLLTDLSLLSKESYKKICHYHRNVFHITHGQTRLIT